jgi:hypothetical protein
VTAAVAVPYWGAPLGEEERISLRHLEAHLGGYDRFAFSAGAALPGFGLKRFPRRFFRNPFAYSRLLLSKRFYEAFAAYDYVLVYQLDCLVFRDELREWCARGLDYVGAPWLPGPAAPFVTEPAVGNGGFSLRRVQAFLGVLARLPRLHWLRADERQRKHEDLFWSFGAPALDPGFRVASVEEALRFAFEVEPRRAFELAGGRLPFGCHAWARYDRAFWEPHLLRPIPA